VKYLRSCWTRGFSNVLLLLTVFTLPISAQVTNFYVSPTGNDGNSGTSPGTAWQTMNHALAAFSLGSGGAVIHVADGTYSSNVSVNRGGSSPTARLVIQCDNGLASSSAAKGHCKFNASGAAWQLNSGSNFDIRGFDIGGNGNQFVAIDGVPCGPAGHSTCLDSVHIIGNYIHDLAQNISLDSSGCSPFGQAPGAILFLNHHGWYVNDAKFIGNTIINYGPMPNTACNTGPNGMYIDTQGATVQNNLIARIYMFGLQYYGQPCNATISNNTFISARYAMTVSGDGEGVCTKGNVTVNNNISMNMVQGHFAAISTFPCTDSSHQSYYGHNITDGVGPDFVNSPATPCNTTSPNPLTHVSGTSQFANYKTDGTGDYHLKVGSAAMFSGTRQCAAGMSSCVPSSDIAGFLRPNIPSLGAFEIQDDSNASAPSAPSGLTATVQ
jgi:hypothetical protein